MATANKGNQLERFQALFLRAGSKKSGVVVKIKRKIQL